MFACNTYVSLMAVIGIIVTMVFLIDKLWSLLQLIRGFLTPYFLSNEEESTVKKFGEWALITGSTDGIGKEYAKELARRGHSIVLVSRTMEKLMNTAKEIEKEFSVKTKVIAADFSTGALAIEQIRRELGTLPIGVLVNNVGSMYTYPMYVGEVPEEQLWNIININVGAVTLMTRMFINDMRARKKGAIVNVSSGSEMQPLPLMTVYAATKMYTKSFTEALQFEYRKSDIFIQHLTPYFVNTKMNEFSNVLRKTSIFVPDAKMYAKYAAATLGKVTHTTGYWSHGIQYFFITIAPTYLRTFIGGYLNQFFRKEYFTKSKLVTIK